MIDPTRRLFLISRYLGGVYLGCLNFDDENFCQQIFNLLVVNYGHLIEENWRNSDSVLKILRLSAVGSHLPSQFRLVNKNTTGANSKVEAGISAASSRKTSSMISCSTSSVERTSSEFIYKTARNNSLSPVRRKPIRTRQRWSLPRSWRYSAPAPMPGL